MEASSSIERSAALLHGSEIRRGIVEHEGKDCELTLQEGGLTLVICSTCETDTKAPLLQLSWRDVVCATQPPVTRKSESSHSKYTTSSEGSFAIHYIVKNQQTDRCRHRHIHLQPKDDPADDWISQIEEKRKEGKPQKLKVIINPIGGKRIARQQFEKYARPLFELAGIKLDETVTERPQHAVEIAEQLDLSTIDGVVIVGGDGLYMEVVDRLLMKAQTAAGINVNDPEAKLARPTLKIGILPAGTGNATSGIINGIIDFETATLNIIRGVTNRAGIFAVHEPGKLLHFSGLLVGYGVISAILEKSQNLRWMKGRLRYAYVLLTECFGRKRLYDLDIEVLDDKPTDICGEENPEAGATAHKKEWRKLGMRRLTALLALTSHIDVEGERGKMEADPFTDGFHACLISSHRGFQLLRIMYCFVKQKKDIFDNDYTEVLNKIQGLRFRLVEKKKRQPHPDRPHITRLLGVDGEVRECNDPKIEIRYHPHMIEFFTGLSKH